MTHHLFQTYRQAPWRVQIQWIGLFSMALVVIGSVAYLYLYVSAQGAKYGREIQDLKNQIQTMQRQNADLETELAAINASVPMAERAKKLGFKQIKIEDVMYIEVSGYSTRPSAVLALPPNPQLAVAPIIAPEYTRSLADWLLNDVFLGSLIQGATQP